MRYRLGKWAAYLSGNTRILKLLLILIGALYVLIAFLPKHNDFWIILSVSKAFSVDPAHFMVGKTWPTVGYPPAFYALQGTWLRLGSYLFHYDLAADSGLLNSTFYLSPTNSYGQNFYGHINLGLFPFWGMVPILAALFILVAIAYRQLNNKWLTLICFGPITFFAVGCMGQIDVFCALFIFISLIMVQRALRAERYFSLLLLGYLFLGMSMEFKTYGGLLLPAYVIYTLALFKDRKTRIGESLITLSSSLASFLLAVFIVWAPYAGMFKTIMLGGPANNLLQFPPWFVFQLLLKVSIVPVSAHGIPFWPVWLLGYVFLLCYMAIRVLGTPRKYLQDGRYFVFFIFAIVAWFFAAVMTHPQWWMLIVPVSLLMLDNFANKSGALVFVCILIVYSLFYPMLWLHVAGSVTSFSVPSTILVISEVLADIALVSLLLFWIFISKRELDTPCLN